jgi:AbrB family looped-hinge helix DNA binding protein
MVTHPPFLDRQRRDRAAQPNPVRPAAARPKNPGIAGPPLRRQSQESWRTAYSHAVRRRKRLRHHRQVVYLQGWGRRFRLPIPLLGEYFIPSDGRGSGWGFTFVHFCSAHPFSQRRNSILYFLVRCKAMPLATLSSKNQIVIPRDAREALGLKPGDQLLVVVRGDNVIVLQKPKAHHAAIRGLASGPYPSGHLEKERDSWT